MRINTTYNNILLLKKIIQRQKNWLEEFEEETKRKRKEFKQWIRELEKDLEFEKLKNV